MMAAIAPIEREPQVGYNKRLRRHSENLTKLDLQNDNHKNPLFQKFRSGPSEEETIEEGKALFGRFIVDEIDREEGLVTPEEIKVELDQLW